MAAETYGFSHREVAEMMARKVGLREGHWGLSVGFGLGAVNATDNNQNLNPAAVVVISQIGLQRFAAANSMTFDASTLAGEDDAAKGQRKERPARQTQLKGKGTGRG